MKVCKYCGTENQDAATACKQCQANDFKNKCNNCGTVFEGGFCTNCGTKAGATAKTCPKCGENYFTASCPSCGYNPAREDSSSKGTTQTIVVQKESKKKGVSFWTVLLWICFLPIMGIIAIWKAEKLPKLWKIILTAIIVVICIISMLTNSSTTGTVPTPTETTAVTEAPSESPIASAIVSKEDRESTLTYLTATLEDSYGADNCSIEYNEESTVYDIRLWADGIVQGAIQANGGDKQAKDNWDTVRTSLCAVCSATKDYVVQSGDNSSNVAIAVMNDANKDNVLLSIVNGVVVYDAVES
ncbi:MAG: zinc ribbon domain-containing protein [Clostridia bacterium]